MARDKRNPQAIAGQHMIFESPTGFVLADRLSNDLRRQLMTRDDIAMTLATLDDNGDVAARHSVSVKGRTLTPAEIDAAMSEGRYGWQLRPLAAAPKPPKK